MDRFIDLIKQCHPKDICEIRSDFCQLYSWKVRIQIHPGDITALSVICERMKELKSYEYFDKVQKYQVSAFFEQLREIIDKLS